MLPSPSTAASAPPPRGASGRGSSPGGGRSSWHRRASRPVTLWMVALIVVVLIHQWIPQSRWLMVHMVTLGLITTSIMVWGQHFAEALLKTRLGEESRPRQVVRIWLLTAGLAVTILGMLPSWPWVVVLGALIVSAALVWYAAALGAQVRAALAPRFEFTVRAYVGAACLLPLGAGLGAVMAFSPGEPWQGRLLLAHQLVNVLGFVGVTVTGTLLTLWPTVLRTRIELAAAKRSAGGLLGMLLAVVGAVGVLQRLPRLHALRPVEWLGRNSIVPYLVHLPVMELLGRHIDLPAGPGTFALYYAVTIGVCVLAVLLRPVTGFLYAFPARKASKAPAAAAGESISQAVEPIVDRAVDAMPAAGAAPVGEAATARTRR